jgi:hypothetical protein
LSRVLRISGFCPQHVFWHCEGMTIASWNVPSLDYCIFRPSSA